MSRSNEMSRREVNLMHRVNTTMKNDIDHRQQDSNEWPIYALANYDNAGLLIDACRALLVTPTQNAPPTHNSPPAAQHTTSGYQTIESTPSAASRTRQANQLFWWHLIEDDDDDLECLETFRPRLVKLARQVKSALSPFVNQQAIAGLNVSAPPINGPEVSQEAHLRRLSWRRRRRPSTTGATGCGRASDKMLSAVGHLAAGRTFSLDSKVAPSVKSTKRIERWLSCAIDASKSYTATRARGKYGESIVHVLLMNHTNESLIVLLVLLQIWPDSLYDVFESYKFKNLNCLHLTIAHDNELLLGHLLDLAHKSPRASSQLLDQRVSGSLFRSPLAAGGSGVASTGSGVVSTGGSSREQKFWCDQLEHWPTANGSVHLILYDRLRSYSGGGAIYFGQTPLAWAVSFKSRSMFELLVGARGRVSSSSTDLEGNNSLHLCVLNNQSSWTRFLVKQQEDGELSLRGRNSAGLTPFLLACHLGRLELFQEFLELTAVEFWSYSSVRCCGYPLSSLDSLIQLSGDRATGRRGQKSSAVAVILESHESSNEQKSALLSTNVIKKLLEEKWKIFARRLFYRDLTIQLAQLLLMIAATLLRPARIDINYNDQPQAEQLTINKWPTFNWSTAIERRALLRYACELAIVCVSINRLWSFASEWFRYRNLLLQLTYNPLVVNLVLANALMLTCAPLRLISFALNYVGHQQHLQLQLDQLEDVLLIFASPLLWSSLLFFVAAFYVTGPFVAMINYMLVRDLKQFSLIYLIFLYSFAQCIFYINYQQVTSSAASDATGSVTPLRWMAQLIYKYLELLLELFKMTLGVYEFQPYRNSILARLALMLFMNLIPILFNMLIAMMNNTYSLIISQSERAWSFQWAKTLFALERRLDDEQKLFYLKKYAINLSSSIEESKSAIDDGSDENQIKGERFVPGLMIIKRTNCTRAETRRRLVGYWQKSIKRVLDQLKRNLPQI